MRRFFLLVIAFALLSSLIYLAKDRIAPIVSKTEKNVKKKELHGPQFNLKIGQYIASKQPNLNPQKDRNFFLLFWFKAKNMPNDNQRMVIVSKYDSDEEQQGYAVALSNYQKDLHPQVYWKAQGEEGRWYSFSEAKLQSGKWYVFLLSYTENKFLGLHTFVLKDKVFTAKNLGGYELADTFPVSQSAFRIGSLGNKMFNGKIGKFFLLNAKQDDLTLEDALERIEADPELDFKDWKDFDPVLFVDQELVDRVSNLKLEKINHGK